MIRLMVAYAAVCIVSYGGLIKPIPHHVAVDPQKARLGEMLFFDPSLSKDGTVSCASCHNLSEGGDDNQRVSTGIGGKKGRRNAPTVYNAVYNFRQFWDGRAADLKEQILGPLNNPVEMGIDKDTAVRVVKNNPSYRRLFRRLYPDGVTYDNIADAIASFEATLVTPDAPFDRYLNGDKNAISQKAKKGYELFKYKGCIICHNGINIGGNMYNRFGVYKPAGSNDLGRYEITKRKEDKYVFKVPSLRNVALTAPYMHDGRFETLDDAVRFMTEFQLGRNVTDEEIDAIVAFLKSLTGHAPYLNGDGNVTVRH